MNNTKVLVLIVVALIIVVAGGIFYTGFSQNRMERKIESLAKQMELLKIEFEDIKTNSPKMTDKSGSGSFNNLLVFQKKLAQMKEQINKLSKSKERTPLNDYKKKEERLLRDHANTINKAWCAHLDQRLAGASFSEEEREVVVADYRSMLASINDEQFKWYSGEMSPEELQESTRVLGRELYDEMSETIGENKASIALGIIFPDPVVRKSFFKDD